MKKFPIALLMFMLAGGLILAQSDARPTKFQVGLTGVLNHVFSYGSEKDYRAGENDFPVTPGHTGGGIGISCAYSLTSRIGLELEGRYFFRSKMTLKDPSDQDTVDVWSTQHVALSVNGVFSFSQGHFQPYAAVGGGVDMLIGKGQAGISKFGYDVAFQAPLKKMDPLIKVKMGARYFLKPRLGIHGEVGYWLIFGDPNKIHNLNFAAGIFYGF